jgi:hypothetical protein
MPASSHTLDHTGPSPVAYWAMSLSYASSEE